jgi:hypothetical protein
MEDHPGHRAPLVAAVAFGTILGLVQLGLFFTDSPVGITVTQRVLAAALLGAASGVLLGRLRPAAWLPLSLLAAWGAIVMGGAYGLMKTEGWPAVLVIPASLAALGGRAGAGWARLRS